MQASTDIVERACERVFARLCEVGRSVPEGTPAAAFLAGAARHIDEAREELAAARDPDDVRAVLRRLAQASTLLGEVSRLSDRELDGLERVSVIIDGICVTLEVDQRNTERPGRHDPRRGGL